MAGERLVPGVQARSRQSKVEGGWEIKRLSFEKNKRCG